MKIVVRNGLKLPENDVAVYGDGCIGRVKTGTDMYDYDFYTDKNVAYGEGYRYADRVKKYNDAIENIILLNSKPVVDLGCGPGYLVSELGNRGIETEGCDISTVAVNELSIPETRPKLAVASLTALPYQRNQFGLGFCFHVLEHIAVTEVGVAIKEISRVVRDYLYLIIPTLDGMVQDDKKKFEQIMKDPTHLTIAKRQWWLDRLAVTGWREEVELSKKFDSRRYGWVFVLKRN